MKIVLLASGEVGSQIAQYLSAVKANIVCLGLHSRENAYYKKKIKKNLKLKKNKIIILNKKISKRNLRKIESIRPDYILLIFWPHLLPVSLIRIPSYGCVNLHIGYLPYNRGKNANVWPIIDQTPAGVSMHYIDNNIDSGDIISQTKVKVHITDNGKSLYNRLVKSCLPLFRSTWKNLISKKIIRKKQKINHGSIHYSKDFKKLNYINLNKKLYPLDLINQLRAKNFSPFPLPYFVHKGKKIEVDLKLKKKS